jgi:hypothetical protein
MSVLLALWTPTSTDAAVALSNTVACDTLKAEDGSSFDVCYLYSSETPSPGQLENGTVIYIGQYVNTYDVLDDVSAGDTVNNTDDILLFTIEVGRDSQSDQCYVSVSPIETFGPCQSCAYCGDEKYSADCTNIPNGRNVTCEPSLYAESPIFFPLTKEALSTSSSDGDGKEYPSEPPKENVQPNTQAPEEGSSNAAFHAKGLTVAAGLFLLGTIASFY